MNIEEHAASARGLQRYIEQVGATVGVGPALAVRMLDVPATAYLPLTGRLPVFPEMDLALVWDERVGWAAAVEAVSRFALIEVSYLGGDVLPTPAVVARFVTALLAGDHPGRPDRVLLREVADDNLDRRLGRYAQPTYGTRWTPQAGGSEPVLS